MTELIPLRLINKDSTQEVSLGTTLVSVTGASALTVLAAAGAGVKYRIYQLQIGSNTAGAVVMSDSLGTYYCPANSTITIDFGHLGILQGTAATAVTATLAGATLSVVAIYKLDA